jgi:ATP adenylyltransferase
VRRTDKPQVDCILCSIRDKDARVRSLEVWRDEASIALLNLYPYNPGHLMVFPQRHIVELCELEEGEALNLFGSINLAVRALKLCYSPKGYNIGFNIGEVSGASIPHLHAHIVPRYGNELGFIDNIGGAKVLIESPSDYVEKLSKAFEKAEKEADG